MPLGAYHASEIAYVMQTPWALADPAAFTPAQRALSDTMQDYRTAFARSGDPDAAGAAHWPAIAPDATPCSRWGPAGSGRRMPSRTGY